MILKSKTLVEYEDEIEYIENEKDLAQEFVKSEEGKKFPLEAKARLKEIKERYKSTLKELWAYQEEVLIPILKVPNDLDPDTPIKDDVITFIRDDIAKVSKSQVTTHADHPMIEFDAEFPELVFLKDNLVTLEQDLCLKAQDIFQRNLFCDLLASPDIVRSTVLEGCIPDSFGEPSKAFTFAKSSDFSDLHSGFGGHLVGSSSFPSMVSNFVKNVLKNARILPLNFLTIGRQYWPTTENQIHESLFHTQQSTCVSILNLNQEGQNLSYDLILDKIQELYNDIGIHYRIVTIKAENLALAESHRIEIQMWSPLKNDYVCVGHLSKYGEFVSKRLHLKYYDSNQDFKNYSITHGTLLDTFKVIGCLIEHGSIK